MNLPFHEGMAVERKLFEELVSGPQSAAQRYVFFAERQVWKIPDVPDDTPTIPVRRVGTLVLNRNPENFFAETEQIAFHIGNLVPGCRP